MNNRYFYQPKAIDPKAPRDTAAERRRVADALAHWYDSKKDESIMRRAMDGLVLLHDLFISQAVAGTNSIPKYALNAARCITLANSAAEVIGALLPFESDAALLPRFFALVAATTEPTLFESETILMRAAQTLRHQGIGPADSATCRTLDMYAVYWGARAHLRLSMREKDEDKALSHVLEAIGLLHACLDASPPATFAELRLDRDTFQRLLMNCKEHCGELEQHMARQRIRQGALSPMEHVTRPHALPETSPPHEWSPASLFEFDTLLMADCTVVRNALAEKARERPASLSSSPPPPTVQEAEAHLIHHLFGKAMVGAINALRGPERRRVICLALRAALAERQRCFDSLVDVMKTDGTVSARRRLCNDALAKMDAFLIKD